MYFEMKVSYSVESRLRSKNGQTLYSNPSKKAKRPIPLTVASPPSDSEITDDEGDIDDAEDDVELGGEDEDEDAMQVDLRGRVTKPPPGKAISPKKPCSNLEKQPNPIPI
ncbi:hypothetical protein EV360DRAFT_71048 [Lentinula raphanica]|nr:hypothetical protein EV360DRAFT_71048 [Lentinula raphanica]